jgi:hypothetical protein
MLFTLQEFRLRSTDGPTLRIVGRLSQALRSMGVREIPLLVSVDDERDAAVLVPFADDAAANTVRVAQARAALAEALIPCRIAAEPPERRYEERIAAGGGEDTTYYRLAVAETEGRELRDFVQRAATAGTAQPDPALLWLGRAADAADGALALAGYADDSSFCTDSAIEDAPRALVRSLGVRVYTSGPSS